MTIDYKKPEILERFLAKNGAILPRKKTRLSAKMQRKLAREVKKARFMALLPYVKRQEVV